ncbi:type II secretion system protein [Janthinobacterium sp. RB2R34]|uniref:type II secretion system protein n=1 Tax=Janthinobacterium sp. RB2R34 TaxID=3424193 RepID=UPI003F24F2E2
MTAIRQRQRGYTLFELGVVVAVFSILATVLLSRLSFYQEQAERAAVARMIGALRTSLRVQALRLVIDGKRSQLPLLQQQNPLDWLAERQSNDLGELQAPEIDTLPGGNWYFDKADQKLVYLLRVGNIFSAKSIVPLKFKVTLPQVDANIEQLASVPDIVALDAAQSGRK